MGKPNSCEADSSVLGWALAKAKTLRSPDGALATVAGAYADIGNLDVAVEVVQLIAKPRRKMGQLLRLATKFAEAEHLHNASTLVSLLVNDIKAAQYDPYSKVEDLNELACFTHEELNLPEMLVRIRALAVELAEDVTDPEDKARVLGALASMTFAATAQQDKVLEILSEAVRVGKTIEQPDDRNETLARIAASFVEADLNDEALKLVNETGDVPSIVGTNVKIAAKFIKTGRTDEALAILRDARSLAKTITNVIESSWTLRKIAGQYLQAGQYVEAYETANAIDGRPNRIEPIQRKAFLLVEIAHKYATSGQPELASQVLSEAFQAARAIGKVQDGAMWSSQALEAVATGYAELGESEQAFEALEAIEIRPPNPHISAHLKSVGLAKLADTGAKANKALAMSALSQALESMNLIRDDYYCLLSSLAKIAASYALLDEKTTAYSLLSQLVALPVDDDLQVHAVVEVVQRYLEVGQELDERSIATLKMRF